MKELIANKIYDILVTLGGAFEPERDSFIYHHSKNKDICTEWRFQGKLGFGGKYYSDLNVVDCYSEDETPTILKLIEKINIELKNVHDEQ